MSMPPPRKGRRTLLEIFGWPAIIAGLSLVGLIAALIGNGAHDVLSWATLAVPLGAIIWARKVRRR